MTCPKCDNKTKKGAKFCTRCGAAFVMVKQGPTVSIGDRLEASFDWIMEHWPMAIFAVLIVGMILDACKDVLKDLLK